MESVFLFKTYKAYLKALIEGKTQRGLMTKLAQAAGCELSYLSRVLSQEIHITPDHAFKIAGALNLNTTERDYFLCLVDLERAGDPTYRDFLKNKLKSMVQQNEDLSKKTSNPITQMNQFEFLYNSNWAYCAIHLLVSIPHFQSVQKISQRLQIPEPMVQMYLAQLAEMGFVRKRSATTWEYLTGASHTPKNSPLVPMYHSNWRTRAVLDSQNFQNDGLHYTNVQSLSVPCFENIKQLLLSSISEVERLAGPSACEELVNVNIDVFKV